MGRIVDLCGEVAAAADEGPEGLILPPEAWDRLRDDWEEEDIEDALGFVRDSLLQGELVEAADSLSTHLVEALGKFGEAKTFEEAAAGNGTIGIELVQQLAHRVERLEEILEAYREGRGPNRMGFDSLQRRLLDLGIESEMGSVDQREQERQERDEEEEEELTPESPERARSLLFTPFPIGRGGLTLPNRIWLPAMVTWRGTEDGFVTPSVREIYLRYAQGGPGMIVLEATGIRDVASGPLLRLSHDRYVPGLKALVARMKEATRSLVVPQIIDFLKIARRKPTRAFIEKMVETGRLPKAALQVSDAEFEADLPRWLENPRERRDFLFGYRQTIEDLGLHEIRRIPGWFADAARRAKACGFDGVELHFAHAYTMASFLSVTNGRTDAYGGSFENRMRLPLEVIEAVRGAVGREFLVGCRFLGSEDIRDEDGRIRGNTLEDASAIAVELARAGLDFLSVSRGGKFEDAKQPPVGESAYPYTGHSGHTCIPRDKRDPFGVNAHLAAGIRRAVRDAGHTIPVVTAGKIHTFDQAESILREEKADLVGMARALLADPDLPRKWLAGEDRLARSCVFCPFCEQEDQHHRVVTCTLWPKVVGDHRSRQTPALWQPGEKWDAAMPWDPI